MIGSAPFDRPFKVAPYKVRGIQVEQDRCEMSQCGSVVLQG